MNSYPPTFKQALIEFTNYVHISRADTTVDKEKLCDGVTRRLSIILGKLVSAPTGESFTIFTAEPSARDTKSKGLQAPIAGPKL